jgi:hypothetical protein
MIGLDTSPTSLVLCSRNALTGRFNKALSRLNSSHQAVEKLPLLAMIALNHAKHPSIL